MLLWFLPNKCWEPENDFLAVLSARPWLIILLLLVAYYLTDKEYSMGKDRQNKGKEYQNHTEKE